MDAKLVPFDAVISEIDWEMPVEVMRDFDTMLLFGKLTAVSTAALTVKRMSSKVCFPIIDGEAAVLVRCYDTRINPVLMRARVIHSSGLECTVGMLELIPYKTHRKLIRYPLCPSAAGLVTDNSILNRSQPCRLLNISAGGACIVSKRVYAVGETLYLQVKPAKTKNCEPFPCEVTRATPRSGGCFEYGLLFAHLSRTQRNRLTNALRGMHNVYLERMIT